VKAFLEHHSIVFRSLVPRLRLPKASDRYGDCARSSRDLELRKETHRPESNGKSTTAGNPSSHTPRAKSSSSCSNWPAFPARRQQTSGTTACRIRASEGPAFERRHDCFFAVFLPLITFEVFDKGGHCERQCCYRSPCECGETFDPQSGRTPTASRASDVNTIARESPQKSEGNISKPTRPPRYRLLRAPPRRAHQSRDCRTIVPLRHLLTLANRC